MQYQSRNAYGNAAMRCVFVSIYIFALSVCSVCMSVYECMYVKKSIPHAKCACNRKASAMRINKPRFSSKNLIHQWECTIIPCLKHTHTHTHATSTSSNIFFNSHILWYVVVQLHQLAWRCVPYFQAESYGHYIMHMHTGEQNENMKLDGKYTLDAVCPHQGKHYQMNKIISQGRALVYVLSAKIDVITDGWETHELERNRSEHGLAWEWYVWWYRLMCTSKSSLI